MFDAKAWLEESLATGYLRHERICFLVTANGGFNVFGWGFISSVDGHQRGLDQNDALDLMTISAFMKGLEAAGVKVFDTLKPYFDAYQAKLAKDMVATKNET